MPPAAPAPRHGHPQEYAEEYEYADDHPDGYIDGYVDGGYPDTDDVVTLPDGLARVDAPSRRRSRREQRGRGRRGQGRGAREPRLRAGPVLAAGAVGVAVSVGLGVYGRFHEPTFVAVNVAGFSSGLAAKAWLSTAAFALVLVQIVSSRRALRGGSRVWSGLHRWSGRAAVLVTVPVAVHCLYALGFQDTDARVLVHSLAGCAFYGAFVAKMVVLPRSGTPGWTLPLFGGLVATAFTTVWLTSAVWFFATSGIAL
jgi:hypothetical protein